MPAPQVIRRKKADIKPKLKVIQNGQRSTRKKQLEKAFPNVNINWMLWADRVQPNLLSMFESHLEDTTQAHEHWMKMSFYKANKLGLAKIINRMREGKSFYEVLCRKRNAN